MTWVETESIVAVLVDVQHVGAQTGSDVLDRPPMGTLLVKNVLFGIDVL